MFFYSTDQQYTTIPLTHTIVRHSHYFFQTCATRKTQENVQKLYKKKIKVIFYQKILDIFYIFFLWAQDTVVNLCAKCDVLYPKILHTVDYHENIYKLGNKLF